MFIIGTGSVLRVEAAEVAVQRYVEQRPAAARGLPPCDTARIALAPSFALFGVPSSSIILRSIVDSVKRVVTDDFRSDHRCSHRQPLSERLCRGNGLCRRQRSSTASWRRWKRRMERSRGPCTPDSRRTSDFNSRVAAGVEDLACVNVSNDSHCSATLL